MLNKKFSTVVEQNMDVLHREIQERRSSSERPTHPVKILRLAFLYVRKAFHLRPLPETKYIFRNIF